MARELLSYTITADTTQAKTELRSMDQITREVDATLKKLGLTEEQIAKDRAGYARLSEDALKRIEKGTSTLEKETQKLGTTTVKQTGVMNSALTTLAQRLVAAFAIERVVSFGLKVVETAGKITDLADKTGLSTAAIQKFGYAANLSGTSIDTVANAISVMSKNLVGGNKGAVEALDRLGLSHATLMRMDPEQAFLAITEAIRTMKNPMEQSDAAMRIFGRGGKELLPAIKAGFEEAGDEAQRLGIIMSDQSVRAMDELGDNWTRIWGMMQGWTARVINGLIQTVSLLGQISGAVMPEWLKTAVDWGTRGGAVRLFGTGLGLLETATTDVGGILNATAGAVGPKVLGEAGGTWAPADVEDLLKLKIPEPVVESTKKLTKAKQDLKKATEDVATATLKFLQSQQQLIGVNQHLLSQEQIMFTQRGVVGTNPGFGNVPGVPNQRIQIGLPGSLPPGVTPESQAIFNQWGIAGASNPGFGNVPGNTGRGWGNSWNSNAGRVANGALMGMDLANGAMGFWGATNVAGRGNRAMAGAQSGAQMGMMFGPYGALIGMGVGALVGALRNPGFEQEVKRISKNFGVNISEELARSIDKLRRDFRGDRQAAEIFSVGDIIAEAGGVTDQNVDRLLARTRDIFVMLETGKFTAEQATQALDKSFGYFADHLAKSGGLASDAFLELLALNERFGTDSQAIADFILAQVDTASQGLAQYLANATVTSQEAADGVVLAVGAMFTTLQRQGLGLMQIMEQLGPSIETLALQLQAAGLEGGEAFNDIAALAAFAADEGVQKAATAVDGLNSMMRALHNGGMLNEQTFQGLARSVYDVYQNLELQGKGGEMAWQTMQPGLQTIWELQQKFGWTTDEVTQNLVDQAAAAGLVGDKFRPAGDIMKDLLGDIKDILSDIRGAFLGLPAAAQTAANGITTAMNGVTFPSPPGSDGNNGGEYRAHGGVIYAANGWPRPRGTDTIPAMLTPGEGVLSRRGMAMLGALNSGRPGLGGGGSGVAVTVNLQGALLNDSRQAEVIAEQVGEAVVKMLTRERKYAAVIQ
jgi:hypothetical protein